MIEIGRETTDLDFLLTRMKGEEKELGGTFEQIAAVHSEDGFTFSFDSIEPLDQPHMNYPGYRVVLNAVFAKMKDKVQIDIRVGDIVESVKRELSLVQYRGKPLFESAISLLVYPVKTTFAEKLETILSKGAANSRMKDYHDLFLLIRHDCMLNLDKLSESITTTFSHRGTSLRSIEFDETSLKDIQRLWTAHLHGLGDYAKDLRLPTEVMVVIEGINQFVEAIDKDSKLVFKPV